MKILWKSGHPEMPTGYGQQTALVLPRLKAAGHEIAISCTAGQVSHPGFWNGIPVFGCSPYTEMGEDTMAGDAHAFGADLVITFLCTWVLKYPPLWRTLRTVHVMNVDCTPMSWADYQVMADTGGMPAATSLRGAEIMRAGGKTPRRPDDLREPLDPLYLPHGIDTRVFCPVSDKQRHAIRAGMNLAGRFVVGMNFMNNDKSRKNITEQLRGFADFQHTHPDAVLLMHAIEGLPDGYNLPALCSYLGIKAVKWTPQYELVAGLITPQALADWYRAQDVYLGAGNEGVGLPGLEAQACGTPVILLDAQSGPEIAGKTGWLVGGDLLYNNVHRADWLRASAADVTRCLEEAYEDARNRREAARDQAVGWEIGKIVREHWEPALAELE